MRASIVLGRDGLLIDRLYEAAVIPEIWPDVCERIGGEINAFSTTIMSIGSDGALRWVSSPSIAETMARYAASDISQRNVRPMRALTAGPGIFLRDVDMLSEAELAEDPLRREMLEPLGIAWELGCAIAEPSGTILVSSILGRTRDGPFSPAAVDRMNALKPDLARASFLATRLAFGRARTMTQTLSAIGLPAAVITLSSRVLSMNEEMARLSPRLSAGARDVLLIEDQAARSLMADALHRLGADRTPLVQSIAIASDGIAPALVLHVVPVKRDARDIFGPTTAILIATTVGMAGPPDLRVISGLFDLTPMEARIAQALVGGGSIDAVAVRFGIGRETVKFHLKSIFQKTGVHRQTQLISLLSGLNIN